MKRKRKNEIKLREKEPATVTNVVTVWWRSPTTERKWFVTHLGRRQEPPV
jgi:hypothetical protein